MCRQHPRATSAGVTPPLAGSLDLFIGQYFLAALRPQPWWPLSTSRELGARFLPAGWISSPFSASHGAVFTLIIYLSLNKRIHKYTLVNLSKSARN